MELLIDYVIQPKTKNHYGPTENNLFDLCLTTFPNRFMSNFHKCFMCF